MNLEMNATGTTRQGQGNELLINADPAVNCAMNGMNAIVRQALALRSQRMAIAFGAALLGSGCDLSHAPVLDPKGPIALAERNLLFTAVVLMLIVVIPVFVDGLPVRLAVPILQQQRPLHARLVLFHPDRCDYLAGSGADRDLAGRSHRSNTHKLDPYRADRYDSPPLDVQVVAQDWKWLFIYPEHGIAVVNQLVFPSRTPLSLKITSDTVMNSFDIPALGGRDLCHGRDADATASRRRRARTVRGQKHPIQRVGLFRSALPGDRHVTGRISMPGWRR